MTHTIVYDDLIIAERTQSMKRALLGKFDSIRWRHHGIGCLQGYLIESEHLEIRAHIWSPLLLKPGIDVSGDIHDHRFDMRSYVLHGTISHEEIRVQPHDMGAYAISTLETHARNSTNGNSLVKAKPEDESYVIIKRDMHFVEAGKSYYFPREVFHRSPMLGWSPRQVAVTLIEKLNQSEKPARLLHLKSTTPIDAFGHAVDEELIADVRNLAFDALLHG